MEFQVEYLLLLITKEKQRTLNRDFTIVRVLASYFFRSFS